MHYQFSDRALYPSLRELWCGQETVPIEPKVFDVLLPPCQKP